MKNRYVLDIETDEIYDTKDYDTEFDVTDRLNSQDKKIKELKKQLKEKNREIKELKDKMETWQSELFDKLEEVTQIIDDCSIEIDVGNATPSLMIIGSKEFEKDIDEIIDKFTK